MISVNILIDGKPILTRNADIISQTKHGLCLYMVDMGTIISHDQNDGHVKLAHKLLDTILEPRGKK